MLIFSSRHRYFFYQGVTDMRKSFDGLSGLVRQNTDHDILSGDVFIFINRRADRIKLLLWDVSGFVLFYKRLEKGTFKNTVIPSDKITVELAWSDLIMLLEGIEIRQIKRRKRFKKKVENTSSFSL